MDKKVFIVGTGPGDSRQLTLAAHQAIHGAGLLIGAARLLEGFAQLPCEKFACLHPQDILAKIEQTPSATIAVLMSGDVGFYSGAKKLLTLLAGYKTEVLPGIGSLQYLCAQLGTPWEDVHAVSAHGKSLNIAAHAAAHPRVFFLTGGEMSARSLCTALAECGMGDAKVTIGSRLSYPDQIILTATAAEAAAYDHHPLSVVLVERGSAPRWPYQTGGIPDGLFQRGDVPMTKAEVRCISIAKLRLRRDDVVYDIGAGTGSVSVETALSAPDAQVFAIEHNPQALALIAANRAAFGAHNIHIVEGLAPQPLRDLPAPDAVFIGGSKGRLQDILDCVLQKNPRVRVVVNAITLETLNTSLACMEAMGFAEVEVVQLGASRLNKLGASRLLQAQNPVFIISGQGAGA